LHGYLLRFGILCQQRPRRGPVSALQRGSGTRVREQEHPRGGGTETLQPILNSPNAVTAMETFLPSNVDPFAPLRLAPF
jgi:hypothetical protein